MIIRNIRIQRNTLINASFSLWISMYMHMQVWPHIISLFILYWRCEYGLHQDAEMERETWQLRDTVPFQAILFVTPGWFSLEPQDSRPVLCNSRRLPSSQLIKLHLLKVIKWVTPRAAAAVAQLEGSWGLLLQMCFCVWLSRFVNPPRHKLPTWTLGDLCRAWSCLVPHSEGDTITAEESADSGTQAATPSPPVPGGGAAVLWRTEERDRQWHPDRGERFTDRTRHNDSPF